MQGEGLAIDIHEKNKLKDDMDKYYNEKREGYLLRSKIKWQKEGEKCTAYFFGLEKKRQKGNVIHQLMDENDVLQNNDSEILSIMIKYYDELFASKNVSQQSIDEYLDDDNINVSLSALQKESCEKEISKKEVKVVVDHLKNDKSPGIDGIIPEFYKKFWNLIEQPFMNMLEDTYRKGELPHTLRIAVIALLFKKNEKYLLKNYRPISLTNYNYKILAFTLANRVQKVLKNLISNDQTGYVKDRFIGMNCRIIEDYFELCENAKLPGILLCLDFEKAFDSLEWNFMFSVLKKFNFGENFIKWVKILYNNPLISIKNNGWLSDDITINRGVRQGCPLSGLIFILAVEILAIKIRSNNLIRGYKGVDKEIKTSLYADDSTLFLDSFDSMSAALETVSQFTRVAGPKLNIEKTEGILLGTLKGTLISHEGVKFTKKAVRCLGIYIGHNKEECFYLKNRCYRNRTRKLEKKKFNYLWETTHNQNFSNFKNYSCDDCVKNTGRNNERTRKNIV